MNRVFLAVSLSTGFVLPAHADVTLTATVVSKAATGALTGQSVTYVKGLKMRSDQTVGKETMTTIVDLDLQQMITFASKKREAEILDLAKMAADLQKAFAAEPTASIKPNGQNRDILTKSCEGLTVASAVPSAVNGSPMQVVLNATVWVAKDAPGASDYSAFYRSAAEKGLLNVAVGGTRVQGPDGSSGGQIKNMAALNRLTAESGGLPYETELSTMFEGGGKWADFLKMASESRTTTVTAVSTDPIADGMFTVPMGYKTKKR